MRNEPLHVGDLVCIKGYEIRIGVVLCPFRYKNNVYCVFWFADGTNVALPRAILKKIETDKKCP
jgi:hypothetical protein